jgi:hypothetical protein
MPGAARESRLWVDREDGCRASDERQGNGGEPEKLLHGCILAKSPVATTAIGRPSGL